MKIRISLPIALLACATALLGGQSPAAPQAEQKPGSIEGVVLLETTQEPVRRVEVSAYLQRINPQGQGTAGFGMPTEPLSTVTDAEGKFRFANVEPGTYFLNIRRQGFVVPRRSSFASTSSVKVASGETMKGLKFSLSPQAIIAGRVTDEDGEPVQGAMVFTLVSRYANARQMWTPEGQGGQTNDKGEFRITGLPGGKYLLSASPTMPLPAEPPKPGQPAYGYVGTYYPGVINPAEATKITITAGQELAGHDISLKKTPVYSIRGKVLDLEGQPITEFFPNLMPKDMPFMRSPSFTRGGRQPDGSFQLNGIPSGSYVLMINLVTRAAQGAPAQNMVRQALTAPVEVGNHDITDLVIRMEPPIQVTGSIKVEGEGEKPALANVSVSLIFSGSMNFGGLQARTKEDGTFTMEVQSRGRYRLRAFGLRAQSTYLAAVRIGSEDYLAKEIDLTNGSPGPISLIFRTDGGQVTGTAERPEGQNGPASAYLIAKDPELRSVPGGFTTAALTQTGTFTFSNVRPGEYWVVALDSNQGFSFESPEIMAKVEAQAGSVKVQSKGSASVQVKVQPTPEQ